MPVGQTALCSGKRVFNPLGLSGGRASNWTLILARALAFVGMI
jgi:hypothetical protein